jgi:integrase
MASISTDSKGRHRIQFYDANGGRKGFSVGRIPKRDAESIASHVGWLNSSRISGQAPPVETSRWLAEQPPKMRRHLIRAEIVSTTGNVKLPTTLGPFVDAYIAKREATGAARRSIINYKQARASLCTYFGESKPLVAITVADAKDWRVWMATNPAARKIGGNGESGLDKNTYNRRCGFARQFFAYAVDARLLSENPFKELKGIAVKANRTRDFHVTREDAEKVLEHCPDTKSHLIFALARFGGLRCPSEHPALQWGDVDWQKDGGKLRINSPKTGERYLPLFGELRGYLEDAFADATARAGGPVPPNQPIVEHLRDSSCNFATQLARIVRKAGLTPWPKLFQNLRLTRQNELAETWPIHVVCEWIGNSEVVAKEHYLRASAADFTKANDAPKVVRKVVPQPLAHGCTRNPRGVENRHNPRGKRSSGQSKGSAESPVGCTFLTSVDI